uniref:N-acetyltransferase domain-containing protein n=1 Tax=Anisakis simplex TaxID=6269 RepID=A0A0M3K333_ANISI
LHPLFEHYAYSVRFGCSLSEMFAEKKSDNAVKLTKIQRLFRYDSTFEHEKWLMAYEDYPLWLKAFGDQGFALYTALTNDKKDVVGSVALAKYPAEHDLPRVGTLGMYFVHPDYRGTGVGTMLFNKAIAEWKKDGGNMALNGVQKMSPKYAAIYGFNKLNDWHPTPVTVEMRHANVSALHSNPNLRMVSIDDVKFEDLLAYDMSLVGSYRVKYLCEMLRSENAYHKIAVEDGKIVGIINARKVVSNSLSIGPFYANNKLTASSLLRSLLQSISNVDQYSGLLLCIPTSNKNAFSVIQALSDGNHTVHPFMISQFTDQVVGADHQCVYAITDYAMSYI